MKSYTEIKEMGIVDRIIFCRLESIALMSKIRELGNRHAVLKATGETLELRSFKIQEIENDSISHIKKHFNATGQELLSVEERRRLATFYKTIQGYRSVSNLVNIRKRFLESK